MHSASICFVAIILSRDFLPIGHMSGRSLTRETRLSVAVTALPPFMEGMGGIFKG
jgi:hypothetical protein